MGSGMWMVIAGLIVTASAQISQAAGVPVGNPRPLGPRALAARIDGNAEIATFVARRGYPDWAEEIEVDSPLPLDTHEVRLYYLRLDREVGFTRAFILGHPDIGLQQYERPLAPAMREWIEHTYLMHDPARRAELAADRAVVAAERAERGADVGASAAVRAERMAREMERSFHRQLRK